MGDPACIGQTGEHGAALHPKWSRTAPLPASGDRSNPHRGQRRAPAAARGRADLVLKPRGVTGRERCGDGSPQPRDEPPRPAPTASPRLTGLRARRAQGTPGRARPGQRWGRCGAARRAGPLGCTSPRPRGAPAARYPLPLFGAPFRPRSRCPVPTLLSPLCLWLLPFLGLSCFCTDPRGDKLLKYLWRCPCGANVVFWGGRSPGSLGHRSPSVRGWAGGRGTLAAPGAKRGTAQLGGTPGCRARILGMPWSQMGEPDPWHCYPPLPGVTWLQGCVPSSSPSTRHRFVPAQLGASMGTEAALLLSPGRRW